MFEATNGGAEQGGLSKGSKIQKCYFQTTDVCGGIGDSTVVRKEQKVNQSNLGAPLPGSKGGPTTVGPEMLL